MVVAEEPLKVDPEEAPLPELLKVTALATLPALPVMLAFRDVVEIWYKLPALAPMRPVRAASLGGFVKTLVPPKVLSSPRSVVEATTMFADPSKEIPLMLRGVWSFVAVPALPPIESDAAVPVKPVPCLLYTSDAADDLLCVDLGGRRI